MFELVKALNDGAEVLKTQSSNPISINAGCELFIAFVTLFPHDSAVRVSTMIQSHRTTLIPLADHQSFANLKTKLIQQGQHYATEALTYRKKIAELAVGFIKDGSVVSIEYNISKRLLRSVLKDSHTLLFPSGDANLIAGTRTETDLRSCSFLPSMINQLNIFGLPKSL
jgi:translation initiation factor eIF-2B subunit alpha